MTWAYGQQVLVLRIYVWLHSVKDAAELGGNNDSILVTLTINILTTLAKLLLSIICWLLVSDLQSSLRLHC